MGGGLDSVFRKSLSQEVTSKIISKDEMVLTIQGSGRIVFQGRGESKVKGPAPERACPLLGTDPSPV